MTVITVAATDTVPTPKSWELPPGPDALRSPIPRGLITYSGTDEIATLGAGDETAYSLALTLPTGFAYLPRNIMVTFLSDDLVANFNLAGFSLYNIGAPPSGAARPRFNMTCPGETIEAAVKARMIWVPGDASMKLLLGGGDTQTFFMSDMDAGGSTAGDMSYHVEYYVFDVDQVDKWEINTPIPIIAHTSF